MLPRQLAVGAYYQTGRWAVGVDYVFQNWGGRNSGYEMTGTSGSGENKTEYKVAYTNTSTIKMGVEYTRTVTMRVTSSNAGPTVRVSATEPTTRRSTGTSSRSTP